MSDLEKQYDALLIETARDLLDRSAAYIDRMDESSADIRTMSQFATCAIACSSHAAAMFALASFSKKAAEDADRRRT